MLRILLGFVFAAAAVTGITMGTLAAFGDTEASLNNEISASSLDLEVDLKVKDDNFPTGPDQNTALGFGPSDLDPTGATKILTASGVFPGDSATGGVSLHLKGDPLVDSPARVFLTMSRHDDRDNNCNEPEGLEETGTPGVCSADTLGELDNESSIFVWYDYGSDNRPGPFAVPGDTTSALLDPQENSLTFESGAGGEATVFSVAFADPAVPVFPLGVEIELDADPNTPAIDPFVPSTTYYIGLQWNFALAAGFAQNVAQTDSFQMDFVFEARQP